MGSNFFFAYFTGLIIENKEELIMFEGPVLGVVIILLFVAMGGIVFYYQRENKKQDQLIDKLLMMLALQQTELEALKREQEFKKNNNIKAD